MKIAVVGKGNVGGGLANRWEKAGHDVQWIGSEGGRENARDVVEQLNRDGGFDPIHASGRKNATLVESALKFF
jgi:predicted dinucleotide-binding enzyme